MLSTKVRDAGTPPVHGEVCTGGGDQTSPPTHPAPPPLAWHPHSRGRAASNPPHFSNVLSHSDPMLCRTSAHQGGALGLIPDVAVSVQPPASSSRGHPFSLAVTLAVSCLICVGWVPSCLEMALTAMMSLLTNPVATNSGCSFHGSMRMQVGLPCDH